MTEKEHKLSKNCWCKPEVVNVRDEPVVNPYAKYTHTADLIHVWQEGCQAGIKKALEEVEKLYGHNDLLMYKGFESLKKKLLGEHGR